MASGGGGPEFGPSYCPARPFAGHRQLSRPLVLDTAWPALGGPTAVPTGAVSSPGAYVPSDLETALLPCVAAGCGCLWARLWRLQARRHRRRCCCSSADAPFVQRDKSAPQVETVF